MSKTAIFNQPGKPLTLIEVLIPALKSQKIIVRVEYSTLCRSAQHTVTGKRHEKSPTLFGHEIVGRIEKFSTDPLVQDFRGRSLQTGDRITWSIYASDPTSYYSKTGIPQKATGLLNNGYEQHTTENTLHVGLEDI